MAPAARTNRSLARHSQLAVGACAVVAIVASCGGNASAAGCRRPGERFPHLAAAITVAQAVKRQGDLVLVRGAFFARDGTPQRLCASLVKGSPPRCGEPSLAVDGVRDLAAFDHGSSNGRVQWVESASIGGRVAGGTLRFELACATQRVQRAFRDRTGETPTLNTFGSNADVERLDFATLPSQEPTPLRRRFGYFSILVSTDGKPVHVDRQGLRPGTGGIIWNRDAGQWIAIRRYGHGVALAWMAGPRRRLDARWRRLDAVLAVIARG